MAPALSIPPVNLFPPAPKFTLVGNGKMKDAVAAAVQGVVDATPGKPAAPFAISILDLSSRAVGGFNDGQEHYAASVVKVGVMYAAHALLDMVNRYNALRSPTSPEALFQGLRTEMDGAIGRSSRVILGGTSNSTYRVPRYESVFVATKLGKTLNVRFRPNYLTAMADMIIPSSNKAAATCIHGIGYSYLNGVLEHHGFFKAGDTPADHKGVWVGGDFTGEWPYVRIPCVNDIDTAQGCTSQAIAHLMAVIMLDDVLPGQSHIDMLDLLKRSAHGPDPSWLLRSEVSNRLAASQVTHAKIGIGPLKIGSDVYSEVCGLNGVGSKRYVVGFVNINYRPYSLDDIVTVVKEAVRTYEAP